MTTEEDAVKKREEREERNFQLSRDDRTPVGIRKQREYDDVKGGVGVWGGSAEGQRSSGGVKAPGVHSLSLPTLLLLEELTDVLRSHNLPGKRWWSHDTGSHMVSTDLNNSKYQFVL